MRGFPQRIFLMHGSHNLASLHKIFQWPCIAYIQKVPAPHYGIRNLLGYTVRLERGWRSRTGAAGKRKTTDRDEPCE